MKEHSIRVNYQPTGNDAQQGTRTVGVVKGELRLQESKGKMLEQLPIT